MANIYTQALRDLALACNNLAFWLDEADQSVHSEVTRQQAAAYWSGRVSELVNGGLDRAWEERANSACEPDVVGEMQ